MYRANSSWKKNWCYSGNFGFPHNTLPYLKISEKKRALIGRRELNWGGRGGHLLLTAAIGQKSKEQITHIRELCKAMEIEKTEKEKKVFPMVIEAHKVKVGFLLFTLLNPLTHKIWWSIFPSTFYIFPFKLVTRPWCKIKTTSTWYIGYSHYLFAG